MKHTQKEKKIISEISRLIPNVTYNSPRAGNQKQVHSAHYFIPPENKIFIE